ncbi:hypothetical protein [Dyadobacter sp. NIV53]|uniref:hypothetical protein n=1 Tax=Dyadobacter sp. NIV53 TaxID=2861765 RepID=UPI001C87E291|nr:hypothetical protein [Dyadobacter sp. NIV53]
MKNVMKSVIAAACGVLLLSANVSAAMVKPKAECKNNTCNNFRVGMYRVKNTVTMNLLLEKIKGERVAIRLLNDKGIVMHEEMVGKAIEKYGRKLNFSEVQDGNYTLEISDENEKIVKNINLTTNEVTETETRNLVAIN